VNDSDRDSPSMLDLIERKKAGRALDEEELRFLCRGVLDGSIPDYQLAAWLMAVWFKGMDAAETLALTRGMVATGATMNWSGIDRPVVDKHSTGGVGDKTSLVLVPLVAAAGLAFAKMSGRGLGHTGGTLDKLESIPGFDVQLSPTALRAQIARIGCALVGQSPELVPADGVLYALRDVTRTVDSVPLIASSIMSKKLAAGAGSIILDVKYGPGAFMPEAGDARALGMAMLAIGEGAGRRVRAVISSMEQPLGRAVGNALEVREAIETLRGEGPDDLWLLTRALGAQLLVMSGACAELKEAADRLTRLRDAGDGLERLRLLIEAQGGDPHVTDDPSRLPRAPVVHSMAATAAGWVAGIDPRRIADAVLRLGGARTVKGADIDPAVGVRIVAGVGDEVRQGEPLAEIHAASEAGARAVESGIREAYLVVGHPGECPSPRPLEIVHGQSSVPS
jgi:pyrimidine-nucleoside phosphorylase